MIMFSGNQNPKLPEAAAAVGVDAFIAKDVFDLTTLSKVYRVIRQ